MLDRIRKIAFAYGDNNTIHTIMVTMLFCNWFLCDFSPRVMAVVNFIIITQFICWFWHIVEKAAKYDDLKIGENDNFNINIKFHKKP